MAKLLVWSIVLLALVGCSSELNSKRVEPASTESTAASDRSSSAIDDDRVEEMQEAVAPDAAVPDGKGRPAPADPAGGNRPASPSRGIARKIIYTADLDLTVENFDGIAERVAEFAGKFDGYIARSKTQGLAGSPRCGQWTLRVPTDNFERLRLAAEGLGAIRSSSSNSQDVSAEYYDVEAHIRNKQQEEERLLKHLATSTSRLDEILVIEREISRVRGEVERLTGRLNVLRDVSALATVNLRIEEIRSFSPPPASTYSDRVAQAWADSLRSLSGLAQSVSIILVAAAPWLVVVGLPAMLPATILLRRYRRRVAAV